MNRNSILPDVLAPNLKVVFCGTAAGTQSAEVGAYYAGRGNKFWRTLYEIGLTPRQLAPHEFTSLPLYDTTYLHAEAAMNWALLE
jgi:double-stranded uracil-DNA glycosylase